VTVIRRNPTVDGSYGANHPGGGREVEVEIGGDVPGSTSSIGTGGSYIIANLPNTPGEAIVVTTPGPGWTYTITNNPDGSATVRMTPPPRYELIQPDGPDGPIVARRIRHHVGSTYGGNSAGGGRYVDTVTGPAVSGYVLGTNANGQIVKTLPGVDPADVTVSVPGPGWTYTITANASGDAVVTKTPPAGYQASQPGGVGGAVVIRSARATPSRPTLPVTGASIAAAVLAAGALVGGGLLTKRAASRPSGQSARHVSSGS
jgi:hypothetical protein